MAIYNLFSTPIKIISMPNTEEMNKKISTPLSENLKQIFIDETKLYIYDLVNKNIDLFIKESWVNINKKFHFDTPHCHGDSAFIGIYYIKTSDKCGDLLLHDPRGSHAFIPKYEVNTAGHLVGGRSYYRITPKAGDLILFPAYVIHSVEPNMSDEVRISLAINFGYKDFNQFKPDENNKI